jgi:WD40 repeat protein
MSVYNNVALRERSQKCRSHFRQSVLGSIYFAEKFNEKPLLLEGHSGCVNSILFSECGSQIITGSDDTNVNFYDLNGEIVNHMTTMHTNNVFYAKDLPASGCNDIVTWLGLGLELGPGLRS